MAVSGYSELQQKKAVAEEKKKQAESTRELDERLLAHRPRAGQIELDMYQERDFELMAHRERVVRHQTALRQRRAALRGLRAASAPSTLTKRRKE